jgi:hypothetical protein
MHHPAHTARALPKLIAVGLFALVAVVAPAGASAAVRAGAPRAEQADPQGQAQVHSFALAPSGDDPTQPGSRAALTYTAAPGSTIQDSVTLWNYSNVQLTFHVYATDAFNNATGAYDVPLADKKPTDVGSWVKVAQENVTVPPSTSLVLPVTIAVPSKVSPGDHSGGIIASSLTPAVDAEGKHVMIDRRVGSRIYLRVTGPVNPSLVVENIASTYHGSLNPLDGSVDVSYTVRNAGNVRLAAHQKVEVSDVFGDVATKHTKDLPVLLPGNAITLKTHFDGVAATIRLATHITLTPVAATDAGFTAPATTTSTGHTWAIPWSLLVVLLLVIVAWRLARRAQRRRRQGLQGGPPGSGWPDGPVPGNGAGPIRETALAPTGAPRGGGPAARAP